MLNHSRIRIAVVVMVISFIVMGSSCTQSTVADNQQYGCIEGRALYSNSEDHSGIILTLDKTDGLTVHSECWRGRNPKRVCH